MRMRPFGAAAVLLGVTVFVVFAPVLRNGFLIYDDDQYVTANPRVLGGLTWDNVRWAFLSAHAANWHPLTWLSHMADVEVFGTNPAGHHAVSLLWHLLNAILLFILLGRTTGAPWRSFAVASLFALHPLRVESVAWIAERKDVLSAFFFLLSIAAYAAYARRPSARRYAALCAAFAAGLLCKPMVATLPLILLGLDLWPLRRWNGPLSRRLVLEKIPLAALAAVAGAVAWWSQLGAGALGSNLDYPILSRLGNAGLSYLSYLGKTFWPSRLAAFYPYPERIPIAPAAAAWSLIVLVTLAAVALRKARPWLIVGWAWFVIMLVPVIGFVQLGRQAMADRYSYLPSIGLLMMIVWIVPDLRRARAPAKAALFALSAAALLALGLTTRGQISHWRDGVALFQQAASVTPDNAVVRTQLGYALLAAGRTGEAERELRAALSLEPAAVEPRINLANILFRRGDGDEALANYAIVWDRNPANPVAHNNGGAVYLKKDDLASAEVHFREALRQKPDYPEALHNLATVDGRTGRYEEARDHDLRAIRLRPDYAEAHANLAASYYFLSEYESAWREVDACLRYGGTVAPGFIEALREKSPRPQTEQAIKK